MENGTPLVAIDLGSNSFRMEMGRFDRGQILPADYLKETVRLGAGLDAEQVLSEKAMQRGLACLSRFAERLRGFAPQHVRAVATQTLREASNREEFLSRARELLGFPIEVISGREEARLIYSGVSHLLPQSDEKRLVIDIGGRSTEMILGHGYTPTHADSFRVGSVSHSMKYFAQGEFSNQTFHTARIAAKAILEEALSFVRPASWQLAYGSSGTVGAVLDILEAMFGKPVAITQAHLQMLQVHLVKAGNADKVKLPSLRDERKPVIGGGLSILQALFELFELKELHGANGALRHGLLYDLISRENFKSDIRSQTVNRLQQTFCVDVEQAARVHEVAVSLLEQIEPEASQAKLNQIGWAADLHEIGMVVSHADYHHHGSYILAHADAPGFAELELTQLGQLVLAQRGRLKKLDPPLLEGDLVKSILALRLAIILCHARCKPKWKGIAFRHHHSGYTLQVKASWCNDYPQSVVLLTEEIEAWRKTSLVLKWEIVDE